MFRNVSKQPLCNFLLSNWKRLTNQLPYPPFDHKMVSWVNLLLPRFMTRPSLSFPTLHSVLLSKIAFCKNDLKKCWVGHKSDHQVMIGQPSKRSLISLNIMMEDESPTNQRPYLTRDSSLSRKSTDFYDFSGRWRLLLAGCPNKKGELVYLQHRFVDYC